MAPEGVLEPGRGAALTRPHTATALSLQVENTLHGAGLPYGYTITVWSSGQVLVHTHGSPGIGYVFLLAAGAALAYRTYVHHAGAEQVRTGSELHRRRVLPGCGVP